MVRLPHATSRPGARFLLLLFSLKAPVAFSLSLSSSLHYDNQHTRNTHTHPAWAYKYDNSAGADGAAVASDGDTSDGGASDGGVEGIPIHADGADVNVNFWITPDAANRDDGGESGGLVVHPAHRGSQVLAT